MRLSKYLLPTLREVPSEAEIPSHQLMLRAGLIRKLASGVYSFLPLGLKTLRNIENIVRDSMDSHGAQELLMSAVLPKEYFDCYMNNEKALHFYTREELQGFLEKFKHE